MSYRTLRINLALALAVSALAAADLPKGEAVLDKYVVATGGKAAYDKIHNTTTTGTVEFKAMGLKGKMTAYAAEPNKHYTEISLEGIGKLQEGSNGEIAWATSAMQGPRVKDGDEKAEALLQGRFNSDAAWRDLYTSAETQGVETIDGKECYKVLLTPKVGPPMTRWYDKETGLLMKLSMTSKSPMGEIQMDSAFSDYRKEGALLLAHKVLTHVGPMELSMTLDSVSHNVEIPKDKFDVPPEVKALVDKQAK
jgi:zinc protease